MRIDKIKVNNKIYIKTTTTESTIKSQFFYTKTNKPVDNKIYSGSIIKLVDNIYSASRNHMTYFLKIKDSNIKQIISIPYISIIVMYNKIIIYVQNHNLYVMDLIREKIIFKIYNKSNLPYANFTKNKEKIKFRFSFVVAGITYTIHCIYYQNEFFVIEKRTLIKYLFAIN